SAITSEIGPILRCSSIYETAAWGNEDQPAYLNQAVLATTSFAPRHVLGKIHEIEHRLGRTRLAKWAPRTIDIDIALYDQLIVDDPDLQIPHRLLPQRRFVLVPLQEI